jgi:hypothetical protein
MITNMRALNPLVLGGVSSQPKLFLDVAKAALAANALRGSKFLLYFRRLVKRPLYRCKVLRQMIDRKA